MVTVVSSGDLTAVEVKRVVNIYEWKQVPSQTPTDLELALALRTQTWTEVTQDQMCHRCCCLAFLHRVESKRHVKSLHWQRQWQSDEEVERMKKQCRWQQMVERRAKAANSSQRERKQFAEPEYLESKLVKLKCPFLCCFLPSFFLLSPSLSSSLSSSFSRSFLSIKINPAIDIKYLPIMGRWWNSDGQKKWWPHHFHPPPSS